MPSLLDRFKRSWNLFISGRSPTARRNYEPGSTFRPDRFSSFTINTAERSIVTTIYNKIAVDAALLPVQHCTVDVKHDYKYLETRQSSLNECLTLSANIDQTGKALIEDIVMSMFDEGVIAVVVTDADVDPSNSSSYEIRGLRVGRILQWYPSSIDVEVYNERTGLLEQCNVLKSETAIIENPFYDIMNCPNSILQRLKKVLADIDAVNNHASSGRLDMIIKLPYPLRTPTKVEQAETRIKSIQDQLRNSELGVAYIDAAEQVIQLNRPLENNLWAQSQDLTSMLYSQLGLSPAIFDGTADEKMMTNYYNRTIEPILVAITEEMTRKFLTKTARSQGQRILFFRDQFKLVAANDLAEIADKMTRNEILSPNEIRSIIGYKPVEDSSADELRNRNLNPKDGAEYPVAETDASAGTTDESGESAPESGVTPKEEQEILNKVLKEESIQNAG